jgi:hypothetical protein
MQKTCKVFNFTKTFGLMLVTLTYRYPTINWLDITELDEVLGCGV